MSTKQTGIKTIGVSEKNYWLIKHQGLAGDSMNDAVTTLLKKANVLQSDADTLTIERKSQAGQVGPHNQRATASPTLCGVGVT